MRSAVNQDTKISESRTSQEFRGCRQAQEITDLIIVPTIVLMRHPFDQSLVKLDDSHMDVMPIRNRAKAP